MTSNLMTWLMPVLGHSLEGCHGLCVPGGPGHKVHMSANLDERNVGGYSVAYRRDDTHFPVYVTAALAAMFFTAAWITGATYWLALTLTAGGVPLLKISVLGTGGAP